jgi:hypothetical protein
VRVRDHVALSTASAALLYPWLGRRVLAAWAASILIDSDHYFWFAATRRTLDPSKAVRFFNEPDAAQDQGSRLLHSPAAITVAATIAAARRSVIPVAVGMALHVGLDLYHKARMGKARKAAIERDGGRCRRCGALGGVVTHLLRQPPILPSYRAENLVSLCPSCHQLAHGSRPARATRTASR